jgi:hypothetical protein
MAIGRVTWSGIWDLFIDIEVDIDIENLSYNHHFFNGRL